MLDITAAREVFQEILISKVVFVRSDHNIVDGLTNAMQKKALQNAIFTGELNF